MQNQIKIVIGSWGSYNECNNRALGSKWLDLSDYVDWDEIETELKEQGFELDGLDEELFIQDIEGIYDNSINWDYIHPKPLFETLKESGVLDNDYQLEVMNAYLESRTFKDFEELVDKYGDRWNDDIRYYKGFDWEDYGREMFECYGYKIPEPLENFIDFEGYGKYMGDCYAQECENGIIEICA